MTVEFPETRPQNIDAVFPVEGDRLRVVGSRVRKRKPQPSQTLLALAVRSKGHWNGTPCRLVRSGGGLVSGPNVVYEDTFRQFPTKHHRATITDVVRPGTYRVRVEVETKEGQSKSKNKPEWNVSGKTSETLIIAIESRPDIEFLTQ